MRIKKQLRSSTMEEHYDLKQGLPNLAGSRLLEITLTADDIKAMRKIVGWHDWLTSMLITRFIP